VLLNFWATWCAPCRVEVPWLVEFYARYRADGLEILGINMDDGDREKVVNFAQEKHVQYPILLKDADVTAAYGGLHFLPQTFFVGRDGRITKRSFGILDKATFESDVLAALGLSSPAK